MSAFTVTLPDPLHSYLKDVVEEDGISVNRFVGLAVAEKLSALEGHDPIKMRSEKGSSEAFRSAMASIPDDEPVPGDELPEGYIRK